MSGYFARLAARTGIGAEGARSVRGDAPPPLATEDIVTFVAPPDHPAPTAFASPQPAPGREPEPAAPAHTAVPAALPPRVVLPEIPDVGRQAAQRPGPRLASRDADERPAPVVQPRAAANERPAEVSFRIPAPAQRDVSQVGEATIRVARPAVAVPDAPTEAAPRFAESRQLPVSTFQAAPRIEEVDTPTPVPARNGSGSEPATAAKPRAATPEPQPAQDIRPQFAVVREPAAPPPANGRTQPRMQPLPSVRIGSIQVDVHAAPPPSPASQPAMAAPATPRPPSLRRFYLRSW